MGMAAFNRARKQKMALTDARARDDAEQMKDLRQQSPEVMTKQVDDPDSLATPPYADEDQLINIPADADPQREIEAMEQAKRNRDRVPTDEEREELGNAHLRDEKTKAIPNDVESGQDRTLKGQEASRRKASEPYEDHRVKPQLDGRKRVNEPEETRPDADTTVSDVTREDATPPAEDDDPATVKKIVEESEVKAEKREAEETAEVVIPVTEDPAEAKEKGTSASVRKPGRPKSSS